MDNEKGFSLIEIVFVCAILGTLALVAVPRLTAFRNEQRVDAEAAKLTAELRYLQEVSRSTQRIHSDFISVTAESSPTITFSPTGYYITENGKITRRHTLTDGLTLHPTRITTPTGFMNGAQFSMNSDALTLTITLQLGGAVRNVIVDSVGRIRVEP